MEEFDLIKIIYLLICVLLFRKNNFLGYAGFLLYLYVTMSTVIEEGFDNWPIQCQKYCSCTNKWNLREGSICDQCIKYYQKDNGNGNDENESCTGTGENGNRTSENENGNKNQSITEDLWQNHHSNMNIEEEVGGIGFSTLENTRIKTEERDDHEENKVNENNINIGNEIPEEVTQMQNKFDDIIKQMDLIQNKNIVYQMLI